MSMTGGTGTPGTPGYVAPRGGYGSGKAIGIGVGAAAGGAGVLFLALHHRGMVSGCVQPADDGLRLVDEKNKKSYVLATSALVLKPGQHVELKGQKSKNESGVQTFEARKLVKDLGSCGASASVAKTPSAGKGSARPSRNRKSNRFPVSSSQSLITRLRSPLWALVSGPVF
jgi:hypothetical protein